MLGIRVAQLRVIFQFVEHPQFVDKHLAYIEWFNPLQSVDQATGMYQISRSMRAGERLTTVVFLDDIVESCHLIPKLGQSIDHSITAENALESPDVTQFFVNSYLRHHAFERFCLR